MSHPDDGPEMYHGFPVTRASDVDWICADDYWRRQLGGADPDVEVHRGQ